MNDNDLVAAMHQAVKKEIIENYTRERRIIEEEINLVLEDLSAYLGGLALWQGRGAWLAGALITPQAAEQFFGLAGLAAPRPRSRPPSGQTARIRGWTRWGRYCRLIQYLYRDLWNLAERLRQERLKLLDLLQEVNADIRRFEANYDMLSILSYLRSLEPMELVRRKILGSNFSPSETALSAQALSFRPLDAGALQLDRPAPEPSPPAQVLPAARSLLRAVCRSHPRQVDQVVQAQQAAARA